MRKYIFVMGGVMSGLGKGIASATIGALLQSRGLNVSILKLDPYLNMDAGTMSPYEHGEVFVTQDGGETDLDIGTYERFLGKPLSKNNAITAGKIYRKVIDREREGTYLGETIQLVPHVTDEIKNTILNTDTDADILIVEVGGTVGDMESVVFLESIRQLLTETDSISILLTFIPFIQSSGEYKTKPSQRAVKELRNAGITPDIMLCRSDTNTPKQTKNKITALCGVKQDCLFSAVDVDDVYKLPILYSQQGVSNKITELLKINNTIEDLNSWEYLWDLSLKAKFNTLNIGIIIKYEYSEAYKSLIESLTHAGWHIGRTVKIVWIDAESYEVQELADLDGIIVPGGFGNRGVEGKINAIEYAREHDIPFLGICMGMQLAVIEYARNILGMKDANSSEFAASENTVIGVINEETTNFGGTLKLGNHDCVISDSELETIYGTDIITERHRHRYEVLLAEPSEKQELQIVGREANNWNAVIIKNNKCKFFIGVQFHPEFNSTPHHPNPIIKAFIESSTGE